MRTGNKGFTLIELLLVLAIIATLLMLSAPRWVQHEHSAREAVLRENLLTLRRVIEAFRADTGRYPESLAELVERRYLRSAPLDPLTESPDSWTLLPPPEGEEGRVYEVRSGAPGQARDGTAYADW